MYRGSRKHVLDWVEHPYFVPQLLAALEPVSARITSASTWKPAGYRWPDEARLEEWGPRALGEYWPWRALQDWWLAAARGANTPNWDIAATADIEGRNGLILVEAKANVPEISDKGKDAPSASEGSRANHERIGLAIDEARLGLLTLAPTLSISRDRHYQLANRIAFTWKLASLGIPVVLVYLGFTGDEGIADVGRPIADAQDWRQTVGAHFATVGAAELLERRHQLSGAPFWMIVRARAVLESSPAAAV